MLNRLFVIAGLLVILAIGAAFVVPRFIQWSDYRGRLEAMAAQAFGAQVAITGDIQLTLLPQPQLVFTGVRVGRPDAPEIEVERVEAEFSLFDFLSDRYKVTRLELVRPSLSIGVSADGSVSSGIVLGEGAEQSNVSIANAQVLDGRVQVLDARSAASYGVDGINGDLRLDALRGPFSFQGNANTGGASYVVRVSTGQIDAEGATTLSFAVRAADESFSLEGNGALQSGLKPKYEGDLVYRRPPPRPLEGADFDAGQGDLVLEGKVEATADRVLMPSYTLLPDENRAATRLTGAAELALGRSMAFNAVVSGGVISLPPRDATTELTDPPYELVRLLGETPLPPIPSVPGTIGLDVAELNLRGVVLRNVHLDASTDARSWTVGAFDAALPGSTTLRLKGNLSAVDGAPIFGGALEMESQQLDRLAALWRRPPAGNPLMGMTGSLSADVALSSDTLALSAGTLVVAGINQEFDATIGFGQVRELKVDARLTTLGESESGALAALVPDLTQGGSFGATFPKGEINVTASRAVVFGQLGSNLAASARWEGGVLEFSKLAASDLGGAAFDARLTAFGTLDKPELSGVGTLKVADGAPLVGALLGPLKTPPAIAEFLGRSLPATLAFQLDAPAGDGAQNLSVTGKLATADAKLGARLGAGIANALSSSIAATLELKSESPTLMTSQLGLGDAAIFDDRTPMQLTLSVEGTPSNSYEVHARLSGGEDRIGFDGNVVPGDFARITGDGSLNVALRDPSVLVERLGAGGVYVPHLSGIAHLQFDGPDNIRVTDIGGEGISGSLQFARREGVAALSGSLALAALDLQDLLPMLAGAAGTIPGDGPWPVGPIEIGSGPRASTGRIDVTVASVTADGRPLMDDAGFGLDWDAQSISLRDLRGRAGGGTLSLDVKVCCSNSALPAKQIAGRLALSGVPLGLVVPDAIGAVVAGTVEATAQFEGTGESIAAAMAAMTGTGSYTLTDFSAARFDPAAFDAIASLTGIVDMTPEQLTAAVSERLATGPFTSSMFTGSFTIAGGTVRSPNLAIAGQGARIFGGGTLSLGDLALEARYAMSPTVLDLAGALDPTTAEVAAVVTGPVWAPSASYDVSALVDGMKIRASELELARLEQLRLEDEARRKAAAEDRARVAAEQAAAEAARKAAEEEARKAAEAEAAKKAAEAAKKPQPPVDLGL